MNDPTKGLEALLHAGEPTKASAIAAELGIGRQYLHTLVQQLEEISGCKLPERQGRRQYTTGLRDLLHDVRRSPLPMSEALPAHLDTLGIRLDVVSPPVDRVALLEARVQVIEQEMLEVVEAFGKVERWLESLEERLIQAEARLLDVQKQPVVKLKERLTRAWTWMLNKLATWKSSISRRRTTTSAESVQVDAVS